MERTRREVKWMDGENEGDPEHSRDREGLRVRVVVRVRVCGPCHVFYFYRPCVCVCDGLLSECVCEK